MSHFIRIGENEYIDASEIYSFKFTEKYICAKLKLVESIKHNHKPSYSPLAPNSTPTGKTYKYKHIEFLATPEIVSEWKQYFNIT